MMLTRRHALACGLAGTLLRAAPALAQSRSIPQRPSARVIADNDYAGDPDGLVALAHQLLTPKTRTVLVTASALDRKLTMPGLDPATTAAAGRGIALELIRRARVAAAPPVAAGAEALGVDADSPAAHAIVAEAMRDDPLPLIFTCGGPLTNLAAALRLEPAIARRMTVVWIGGGGYPHGGWEYNLAADGSAARQVIERSAVPLWQVPQPAYRQMQASVAELAEFEQISPFGAWLYQRFTNPPPFVEVGGTWPLGDSPLVLLTALTTESSTYRDQPARRILPDFSYGEAIPGRSVRVFETLDARLTFADFSALLRRQARPGAAGR